VPPRSIQSGNRSSGPARNMGAPLHRENGALYCRAGVDGRRPSDSPAGTGSRFAIPRGRSTKPTSIRQALSSMDCPCSARPTTGRRRGWNWFVHGRPPASAPRGPRPPPGGHSTADPTNQARRTSPSAPPTAACTRALCSARGRTPARTSWVTSPSSSRPTRAEAARGDVTEQERPDRRRRRNHPCRPQTPRVECRRRA